MSLMISMDLINYSVLTSNRVRIFLFILLLILFFLGVVLFLENKNKTPKKEATVLTPSKINPKTFVVPPEKEKTYPLDTTFLNKEDEVFSPKVPLSKVSLAERLHALNADFGMPIFIRIFKEESILEVWIKPEHEYVLLKKYPICAYSGFLGPKLKEGDKQAPEGFYKVKKHQLNPNSRYHLSFNLGYPNKYDKAHKRTGSYLMVHGECVSIGCYAMTNVKIEEIYKLLEDALNAGQKYIQVHAFPFYMEDEKLSEYVNHLWYDFWLELKEGYDYFQNEKLPPQVKVVGKSYRIHE